MINNVKSDFSFTEIEKKLGTRSLIALVTISVLMNLFFIQGLRGYFPGIRVALFHVVFGQDVIMNLLVLLALIFLILPGLTNTICKKISINRVMIFSIYIVVIVRLLWAFHLPLNLEAIYSGIIITFYGIFMSTFLTVWIGEVDEIKSNNKVMIIIFSLICAFLIDYLVRIIGFTLDISLVAPGLIVDWQITQFFWLIIQVPLSILCIYLTRTHFPRFSKKISEVSEKAADKKNISTIYSIIFAGIGIFLFLQFNLFLYPNAIAQYTESDYFFNNILNIVSLMITICAILFIKREVISNKIVLGIFNGFMIISLCLLFTLGKTLAYLASFFISISLIALYINVYSLFILLSEIDFKWEKVKTVSNGITIGFLFMTLFSFLHAFTTEWAAILAIFKDLGPLIMILAGIIFSILTIYGTMIKLNREVSEI